MREQGENRSRRQAVDRHEGKGCNGYRNENEYFSFNISLCTTQGIPINVEF